MRAMMLYIAFPAIVLAGAGCSSSTGLADCNFPTTTAAFAPAGTSFPGVVTSIRFSSGGPTPEGGTSSQVDAIVTAVDAPNTPESLVGAVPVGAKIHIVLSSLTPVFSQNGGSTPSSASACALALGQQVNVWIPFSDIFGSGFHEYLPESQSGAADASVTFEPSQVEVLHGR